MARRSGRGKNSKKNNIEGQIYNVLSKKLHIGESRHAAKSENGSNKVDGIYSYTTYLGYIDKVKIFIKWCQNKYPSEEYNDVFKMRKHVPDFLYYLKEDPNKSNSTFKTYRAALCKFYTVDSSSFMKDLYNYYYKKNLESALNTEDEKKKAFKDWLKDTNNSLKRKRDTLKRSRNYEGREHKVGYAYSSRKHQQFIQFCRCTGLRENELAALRPLNIRIETNGDVFLDLWGPKDAKKRGIPSSRTKGGKSRTVEVLEEGKDLCRTIKNLIPEREVIFKKIEDKAPIHSYRAEYLNNLYKRKAKDINKLKNERIIMKKSRVVARYNSTNGQKEVQMNKYNLYRMDQEGKFDLLPGYKDVPAIYTCRGGEFSGVELDREAMLYVSSCAGHAREFVFAQSYLRLDLIEDN